MSIRCKLPTHHVGHDGRCAISLHTRAKTKEQLRIQGMLTFPVHGAGIQGYDRRGHDPNGAHPDFACNECNACLLGSPNDAVPQQPFLSLTSSKTWGVSPGPPLYHHKTDGWQVRIDKVN